MRVLIVGASGQLGRELISVFSPDHQVLPVSSLQLDITQQERCLEVIQAFRPQVVINAAAFTRVDDCEVMKVKAYSVNGAGARNLALGADLVGARYVYVSTDYVFSGLNDSPYQEYDQTQPVNVYGQTKLAGEQLTRAMTHRHFIVRTSWLCGVYGANFVKTILRLAKNQSQLDIVSDQRGCPTFSADLAHAIRLLVQTESYGTYHITNQGNTTWYDFAKEILLQVGSATPIFPTTSEHYVRPAQRPKFSVLDNIAWRAEGFPLLRPWTEALTELLTNLEKHKP